jgi:hypothetical protein
LMSNEPNTTSRTFGVTEGFCGVFRADAVVMPFKESASGAIGLWSTRQTVLHMLVGVASDVSEVGYGFGKARREGTCSQIWPRS